MSRQFNIPTPLEGIVKAKLEGLLHNHSTPQNYQRNMIHLGELLASTFVNKLSKNHKVLAISTAEDADYLLTGVLNKLAENEVQTSVAVFWNHHHSLEDKQSVAPILHHYIQSGYEDADIIVIVKSVISGSCVVRTNLLAMFNEVKQAKKIFVVSPVMYYKAQSGLSSEFPPEIAEKFEYIYFAMDDEKTVEGEVVPGIGGQVYELLGIDNQPVLTGYMPNLVKKAVLSSLS